MRTNSVLRPPERGGFTLLEVLVAGVLVSVGIVVLAQVVSGSIWAGSSLEGRARAARLADSLLSRIEAGEISINETSIGDFEDMGESDVVWEVQSEAGNEEFLRRLTIRVVWEGAGGLDEFVLQHDFFDRVAVIEEVDE